MQTLNTIVTILISFCVIASCFGILAGIIMFIVGGVEKDPLQKKKINKWARWILFSPIIALGMILIFWGLIAVIANTFGN